MRILVFNANMSRAVTDKLSKQARASASAGTEIVTVMGAVMAVVPARIQHAVPVVDCLSCGIRQAELRVSLSLPKPRVGSYAPPWVGNWSM